MRIGYARVSSDDQNLSLQINALQKAKCKRIYEDRVSGAQAKRQGLDELLKTLREGDVVVVWRLDRLGRSLKDLLDLVEEIQNSGAQFTSLEEKIDTTSSGGKLIFHIFGAFSEFERNLIRERTFAGLEAARKRGLRGGRPKSLGRKQQKQLVTVYKSKKHSIAEICEMFGVSKPTLYKYLEDAGAR